MKFDYIDRFRTSELTKYEGGNKTPSAGVIPAGSLLIAAQ